MKQSVAISMKSKLKTPLYWLLGIVVTTVVSKAVEEYFHWSLLGPLASFLWTGVLSAYEWAAQPVSFPLWFVAFSLASVLCGFVFAIRMIGTETQKLRTVEAKVAELQNPNLPKLSDNQQRVLMTIADFIERQRHPNFRELKETLSFTHIVTEGATDVLLDAGLIIWSPNHHGVYEAGLTPRGRACILHPDFLAEPQPTSVTR